MTQPGASADDQQPEVMEPALPRRAAIPRREITTDALCDPADPSAQPIAAHQDAPSHESALQPTASASRFEIAATFQALEISGLVRRFDDNARQASCLSQVIAATQIGWLTASLPRINLADYILPVARIDFGFRQAISKNLACQPLGLPGMHQQFVSRTAEVVGLNLVGHILPAARIDFGFQQAISKKLASWDLGLFSINQQFARCAAALAAPHHDLLRSISGLASIAIAVQPVNFTGISAMAGLTDLFRCWRETAEFGVGLLRRLARAAFKAALHARVAVLDGDDGSVAWFIENWLDQHVTPERIEAVSAALLEDGWDSSVPEDPAHLLADLRSRTARQVRVLKPIWETQLNHRTVGRLDHPVITGNGTILRIADLLPDPQTAEDLVFANECEEQRLHRVLGRLKPDELKVTNVYAQRSELNWAEAARIAGVPDPAAMGERVRRKLKRLGAEEKRRLILQPSGA